MRLQCVSAHQNRVTAHVVMLAVIHASPLTCRSPCMDLTSRQQLTQAAHLTSFRKPRPLPPPPPPPEGPTGSLMLGLAWARTQLKMTMSASRPWRGKKKGWLGHEPRQGVAARLYVPGACLHGPGRCMETLRWTARPPGSRRQLRTRGAAQPPRPHRPTDAGSAAAGPWPGSGSCRCPCHGLRRTLAWVWGCS